MNLGHQVISMEPGLNTMHVQSVDQNNAKILPGLVNYNYWFSLYRVTKKIRIVGAPPLCLSSELKFDSVNTRSWC